MLNFKGARFSIDVILVCIRWYAAHTLSYRYLEEIMEERCRNRATLVLQTIHPQRLAVPGVPTVCWCDYQVQTVFGPVIQVVVQRQPLGQASGIGIGLEVLRARQRPGERLDLGLIAKTQGAEQAAGTKLSRLK